MKAELHPIAKKYIKKLSRTDREYMYEAIGKLEKEPPEGDIKPLVGQDGFRLRTGKFRILFHIEERGTRKIILVTHIEPRGQAYTRKTRNTRGIK